MNLEIGAPVSQYEANPPLFAKKQNKSSHAMLKSIPEQINFFSRTMSLMLGGLVLIVFVAGMTSSLNIHDIAEWSSKVLGLTFIGLMAALTFLCLYSWVRSESFIRQKIVQKSWLEVGFQASSGITTLALTYTLLGISLGIGTLAEHSLTPETIQEVIKMLTAQFALAFMTTVIGLPLSTLLRALLAVTSARMDGLEQSNNQA